MRSRVYGSVLPLYRKSSVQRISRFTRFMICILLPAFRCSLDDIYRTLLGEEGKKVRLSSSGGNGS